MKIRIFHLFDFLIIFSVIALITLGIMFVYSSGFNSVGVNVKTEYAKQIIWASIGLILMLVAAIFDYRVVEKHSRKFFFIMLALLVFTRLFGKELNGAKSWLGIGPFGIQPSEFCKILYIFVIASFFSRTADWSELKRFAFSLGLFLVPFGLILIQPDMGTASVYFPIFLLAAFIAGVPLRYIMMLLLGGILTIWFTVLPEYEKEIAQHAIPAIRLLTDIKLRLIIIAATGAVGIIGLVGTLIYQENKVFYWISYFFGIICASLLLSYVAEHYVLKAYQIRRLIIFINPEIDPRNTGWNIIQSRRAIGSGGFFGEGFLLGNLSHKRYLPQQSTDFIFSILSEEFGFVGGLVVFSLYFLILVRCLFVIKNTENHFGIYVSAGIFGMFLWHFLVNVGMVMGIMPITGIPLLFLSYGGSSLWTAMVCLGVLMSVRSHTHDWR